MITNKEDIENLKKQINYLKQDVLNKTTITIKNTNGVATKFANGTMICTKTVTLSNVDFSTAFGNVYRSELQSLGNFAQEFVELDSINVQNFSNSTGSAAWTGEVANVSNSSARCN